MDTQAPSSPDPRTTDLATTRAVLQEARTVAVLGASNREDRPAWFVPNYLVQHGYTVFAVRPGEGELHGRPTVHRLEDIPEAVDVVNIFRRSDALREHLPELLATKPRAVWLPESVFAPDDFARALAEAGIALVQNRCMKREHQHQND